MKIKICNIFFSLLLSTITFAQTKNKVEHVIIVSIDGLRWQEVFNGMDSAIANNKKFNQKDSLGIYKKYWAETTNERRLKLMPFLWSKFSNEGQIFGNRTLGNKVNVSNPYWFSYPGYNEMLCGFTDLNINTNAYPPNPNTNLLEFTNKLKGFEGKVAAFCAWDAFDRILNEKRSNFPVICGNDSCGGTKADKEQLLLNKLKHDSYNPFKEEALDVYTHYMALDFLKKEKPRMMYISYGETDEWAHEGHYKDYLNSVNQIDHWLKDIWNFLQSDNTYKDKTLLFVTVDHGRGDATKSEWTSHNSKIKGADEIWFSVLGPNVDAKGEMNLEVQLFQKQFAQTIAKMLNFKFECEHPVAEPIDCLFKN
jgi:hypothetical protein